MNGYEKYCELVNEIGYEEVADSLARDLLRYISNQLEQIY